MIHIFNAKTSKNVRKIINDSLSHEIFKTDPEIEFLVKMFAEKRERKRNSLS